MRRTLRDVRNRGVRQYVTLLSAEYLMVGIEVRRMFNAGYPNAIVLAYLHSLEREFIERVERREDIRELGRLGEVFNA